MFTSWLTHLFGKTKRSEQRQGRAVRPATRPTVRPCLEAFEERMLLSAAMPPLPEYVPVPPGPITTPNVVDNNVTQGIPPMIQVSRAAEPYFLQAVSFVDNLVAGSAFGARTETLNANGTMTVTDSLLGHTLQSFTFDPSLTFLHLDIAGSGAGQDLNVTLVFQ